MTASSSSHSRTNLLGVDGGGTSTVAWLAEPQCKILGRGRAGPSNAKAVGLEAARAAIDGAICEAFEDARLPRAPVDVACLGLAGFDRPSDRDVLAAWCRDAGWANRLVTANDGDLVIAAGTPEGWGIGVIAGTGSIAVGRTPDGRTARAGGWGYKIGDEGSGHAVVLDALRLVVRRADGREQRPSGRDLLTERLCTTLGVTQPSQIVTAIYAPDFDRARMAALAPEVLAACAASPDDSHRLLAPAGAALGEMAIAVARSLGWFTGELPLAVAGGFLLSAPAVLDAMLDRLTRAGYRVASSPVPDPVRGAVFLAERALRQEG